MPSLMSHYMTEHVGPEEMLDTWKIYSNSQFWKHSASPAFKAIEVLLYVMFQAAQIGFIAF